MVAPCTFGLLIYSDPNNSPKVVLFLISIFFTNILPFLTILCYLKLGRITALDVPIRKQRVELLAIACIYHLLGFILLYYLGATPIVKGLMFCYVVNTAIVCIITKYWKISIHMIGLGGPFVALWLTGFQFPVIMIIIIILVSLARITLKIHTPAQVIVGTILAIGLAYFELKYLFL